MIIDTRNNHPVNTESEIIDRERSKRKDSSSSDPFIREISQEEYQREIEALDCNTPDQDGYICYTAESCIAWKNIQKLKNVILYHNGFRSVREKILDVENLLYRLQKDEMRCSEHCGNTVREVQ